MKENELAELSKRVRVLEEKNKSLEVERESLLSSNHQDISNLRAAHTKALETLMSYQEENDVLRSAVSPLVTN